MRSRLGVFLLLAGGVLFLIPTDFLGFTLINIGSGGYIIGSGLFLTTQQVIGATFGILGLVTYFRSRKTQ